MSVQPGVDDRLAQRLEARDVQRDVVVDEKDRARAAPPGIGDVRHHALDRPRVKVAAAHLDDRAEAAVVRAAARGLDDVHGPAEQRVSRRAARAARRGGRTRRQVATGRGGLRTNLPAGVAHTSRPGIPRSSVAGLRLTSAAPARAELAKRQVTFARHDEVDTARGRPRSSPAPGSGRTHRRRCEPTAGAIGRSRMILNAVFR